MPKVFAVPHYNSSAGSGYGMFGYEIKATNFKVTAWHNAEWFSIGY